MVDIETEFLYESWYVAGWSSDFEHSLTPLTILDERVVIFRTDKGSRLRLRMLVRIVNYRSRMDGSILTELNVDTMD